MNVYAGFDLAAQLQIRHFFQHKKRIAIFLISPWKQIVGTCTDVGIQFKRLSKALLMTHQKCLSEPLKLNTNKICFHGEVRKYLSGPSCSKRR